MTITLALMMFLNTMFGGASHGASATVNISAAQYKKLTGQSLVAGSTSTFTISAGSGYPIVIVDANEL